MPKWFQHAGADVIQFAIWSHRHRRPLSLVTFGFFVFWFVLMLLSPS